MMMTFRRQSVLFSILQLKPQLLTMQQFHCQLIIQLFSTLTLQLTVAPFNIYMLLTLGFYSLTTNLTFKLQPLHTYQLTLPLHNWTKLQLSPVLKLPLTFQLLPSHTRVQYTVNVQLSCFHLLHFNSHFNCFKCLHINWHQLLLSWEDIYWGFSWFYLLLSWQFTFQLLVELLFRDLSSLHTNWQFTETTFSASTSTDTSTLTQYFPCKELTFVDILTCLQCLHLLAHLNVLVANGLMAEFPLAFWSVFT